MLTAAEITESLRSHRDVLAATYKVRSIGVFGSYAAGKQTEESDIDVLVEFSEPVGWDFFDLQEYLEGCFGKRVDLVTPGALKSTFKEEILRKVRYA